MSKSQTPGQVNPISSRPPPRKRSAGGRTHQKQKPGFAVRAVAVEALAGILIRKRPFDEAFDAAAISTARAPLEPRDRAFARLIVSSVLRRKGEIDRILSSFLTRGLPPKSGNLESILLCASAQLLLLETPAHAAISLAVDQCRADGQARHFSGLANAVLRKVATEGPQLLKACDPFVLNVPSWLRDGWTAQYGVELAKEIALASLEEPALDITAKARAAELAERLGGTTLTTGSIRLPSGGRVEDLPGFAEGDWWVQDTAAALPARLLGNVSGQDIADLCAAPGGKTAQLASGGARVTAVESSNPRGKRLVENLKRLDFNAHVVIADVLTWSPGKTFDAVLLDAPCSATGTIRRHPDILHLKRQADVAAFAALQNQLLHAAAKLVRPGGLLIYCTCSLESAEGEDQVTRFLADAPHFDRVPIVAGESGVLNEWLTPEGDLRTLPCHRFCLSHSNAGMDGFFASRLRNRA